jgi:hypothetical protein
MATRSTLGHRVGALICALSCCAVLPGCTRTAPAPDPAVVTSPQATTPPATVAPTLAPTSSAASVAVTAIGSVTATITGGTPVMATWTATPLNNNLYQQALAIYQTFFTWDTWGAAVFDKQGHELNDDGVFTDVNSYYFKYNDQGDLAIFEFGNYGHTCNIIQPPSSHS